MGEVLTAAQMRATEMAAIESGAVTGLALMERAGQGVVTAVLETWPMLAASPGRALVLCGPGNNGGDGFVVARLLKARGWEVELYLLGDPARLPPDARTNHDRWCASGAAPSIRTVTDRGVLHGLRADLFIDALFGTGLSRPVDVAGAGLGPFFDHAVSATGLRRVAVDIPSGLCADSGRVLGAAIPADLTVTFHAPKPGHFLMPKDDAGPGGAALCGRLTCVDIGLRAAVAGAVTLVEAPGPEVLKRKAGAHKYGHGHAAVLSGGAGRSGAARLAARGALRAGAGLVTLIAPGAAMAECAAQLTAIMLRRADTAADLAELLRDARLNVLCLGPGLGVSEAAREMLATVLALRRATVLDADALTLLAADDALRARLHGACVLTPHGGEFARLFPEIAAQLTAPAPQGPAFSRIDAARAAARAAGCVVLLKGPDTVIAAPDGRCALNAALYERAVPWLATAGAGDVLAGIIAGLMARGLPPFEAAAKAAWLHAGAARAFGHGLIAEDLPEMLPQVFRSLQV